MIDLTSASPSLTKRMTYKICKAATNQSGSETTALDMGIYVASANNPYLQPLTGQKLTAFSTAMAACTTGQPL